MQTSDRNKLYALWALAFVLTAIVLTSWLSQRSAGWPEFTPSDSYANWIIAGFSALGTLVSAVGVMMVYKSLELNRAAVDAAVAANTQTNELFFAESRPWIITENPKVSVNEVTGDIWFDLDAINRGKHGEETSHFCKASLAWRIFADRSR
jgi:hypothetical protein